ncbi:MAG: carboxypeptidase-like regulatory domain-containing protein [Pseudomonadota bacterium]
MSLPNTEQPDSKIQQVAVPQNNRGQLSRLLQKSRNILNNLTAPSATDVPVLDSDIPEGLPPEEVDAYRQKLQEWMAEDAQNAEPYDVILSVKRKGKTISRSVIGIQKGIQTYVPMQDLASALRIKINMDLASQTVDGFWNSEENTYNLNVLGNIYSVKGESFTLPENSAIVQDFGEGLGDIYVTTDLINELWGLSLRFEPAQMALMVETPQMLPIEREKMREARQERFLERNANIADQYEALDYSYVPNEYKIISKPAINTATQTRWDDKRQELTHTNNVRGINDLLFTSADYNIQTAYTEEEGYDVTSARLRFERRADIGHELPLGLKLFEAGDISVQPPSLVDRNQTGAGISVSNKPFRRSQSFDIITVEGTGQPGWDVEIYNDNQLQNFGVIDANGEYRFEGIELDYGKNEIRTVLYGPQGQVEERIENYKIDDSLLAKGDVRVEATVMDANRNLIEVDDVNDRVSDGYFHTASIATGLNEQFTPFVTSTRANTEDGTKNYLSVGTNFTAGGGIGVVEGYKDLNGGEALDARYTKNFAGLKLNARTSFFNDFESEEANFGDAAKEFDGEIRAATSFPTDYGSLRLGTNLGYTTFVDGSDRTTFVTTQSLGQAGFRVSNRTTSRLVDGDHQQSTGRLSADYRISDLWNFRSSANYDIDPDTDLSSALAELRYNDRDRFNASADIRHDLENDNTSLGVDASYDFKKFLGGIGLNWDVGDGFDAILRTSMSLGPFGKDDSYIMSSENLTSKTALKSRIYRDKDEDGVFSEGDEPIQNARLRVNGVRTEKTDEDGFIDIINPTQQGLTTVIIDERSWEDELLVSKDDGYFTALRPVTKPYVDIPVVVSGSVDGNVYFENGKPSPTLRVQLINADGTMVEETTTDFNGYYSFEYVRPGNYTIQADPTHNLVASTKTATVTQDDPFVLGIDLKIAGLNQN